MKVKVSKKGNRKENTSWARVQHTTKEYKPTSATSVLESRSLWYIDSLNIKANVKIEQFISDLKYKIQKDILSTQS